MSGVRLVIGLAWRNLRHRPWQALLLLLAVSLSTTIITLALALADTSDRSWDQVWQATNGFHVAASADATGDLSPAQRERVRADLARFGSAPGVVAAGGPWRTAQVDGEIDGTPIRLEPQVRDAEPAAVNQPLVTTGRWLDDRPGVVVEDGLAAAAGVHPGDTITIAGEQVPVRGAALTVSDKPYPMEQPPTVWISPATAAQLDGALDDGAYVIELRLADPDKAESFVADPPDIGGVPADWVRDDTWLDARNEIGMEVQEVAAGLGTVAIGVVVLTIATAAILVAGRMAAQIRQVGTLKAVGVTPGQVTWVLLVEYLAVALVATGLGLAAGTLLAPPLARLTQPLSVYGAQTPPVTLARAATVVALAISVVVFATVRPALRGARHSTVRSLGSTTRPPRPAGPLTRAVASLPVPLSVQLGLRAATRRRGRFVANTLGLSVGVTLVITALALRDGVDSFRRSGLLGDEPDPISRAATIADQDRISTLGFTIAAFIVILAVVNAAAAAVFSAQDSARNHAIERALGTTPGQTVTAFLVAHLAACLLACALGIPLGIAFYESISQFGPIGLTPLTYVATILTAMLVYTAIALTPARLLARRPIAPQLTYE